MSDNDFLVCSHSNGATFEAKSAAARDWLVKSGRVSADAELAQVEKEGPGVQIFLEALGRKGFTCFDSSGEAVVFTGSTSVDIPSLNSGASAIVMLIVGVIIFAPVGFILYAIGWMFGSGAAWFIGICAAILVAVAFLIADLQKKKVDSVRDKLSAQNFNADLIESVGFSEHLAIDIRGKRLAYYRSGTTLFRDFSSIVGVELEQDGSSIQRTNRGSQVGGAVVGGVLAGGAGLLLGGLSGSKRNEERVHAVTLNIFTRDVHTPTLKVSFLRDPSGTTNTSMIYQNARKRAQDWYARVRAAMDA